MFGFGKKKKIPVNKDKENNKENSKDKQKKDNKTEGFAISESIEENIDLIKEVFSDNDTLVVRKIENKNDSSIKCFIVYTDGLVNNQIINDNIIRPLQMTERFNDDDSDIIEVLMTQVLQANETKKISQIDEIIEAISYGDTVLFADGSAKVLVLNTKGFVLRAVTEPESEKILRGPREGFSEGILTNVSMIRRRVRTKDLKMKFMVFGERTKTKACILYIDGIVNKNILNELMRRLDKFNMDSALDVNYLIEMIKDSPYSPFKTIGESERPDVIVGKMLEGRIAIVLDGTPCVITLPYLFVESFQSTEDYYVNYYYSTFTRLLRIVGFFVTTMVPALYIAMANFHHEMLPTPLLMSISMARSGVPFPTVIEAFVMIVIFQILAETGIRMPSGIGQALSIVGALVVGQAAVEAKLVSAPMIIIIAITGITGLIIPRLASASLIIRFVLLSFAAFLGFYGFMFGVIIVLIHLLNIRSFGVPYLTDVTTANFQDVKDTFFRAPWWKMITRPKFIAEDSIRMKTDGAPKP